MSLVEFRKNAQAVIRRVEKGERIVLTCRGRPVLRLEPVAGTAPGEDDPVYRLADLAVEGGESLDDRKIDRVVYDL